MGALQLLTGDAQAFLDKVWASQVQLHHTDPEDLVRVLSVEDVDQLLLGTAIRTPAVRVARDGHVLPASTFTRSATLAGQPLTGLVDGRKVLGLYDEGASVVLQGLHRYWAPLTDLVRELELTLGHPCQANAYLTPPGAQGFAVHSDTHDVFVFQTHGTKQWEVHDDSGVREVLLEPGVCLYLPAGTPHAARAQDSASLHVTLGVNQLGWRDLLGRVVTDLLGGERYGGRLPAGYLDDPSVLAGPLERHLHDLAADLARQAPEVLAAEQSTRFYSERSPILRGGLTDRLRLERMDQDTLLVRRPGVPCVLLVADERLRVLLGDRELWMPLRVREAMRVVRDSDRLTPEHLGESLDPQSRLVLCRRLVREGLLRVAG